MSKSIPPWTYVGNYSLETPRNCNPQSWGSRSTNLLSCFWILAKASGLAASRAHAIQGLQRTLKFGVGGVWGFNFEKHPGRNQINWGFFNFKLFWNLKISIYILYMYMVPCWRVRINIKKLNFFSDLIPPRMYVWNYPMYMPRAFWSHLGQQFWPNALSNYFWVPTYKLIGTSGTSSLWAPKTTKCTGDI